MRRFFFILPIVYCLFDFLFSYAYVSSVWPSLYNLIHLNGFYPLGCNFVEVEATVISHVKKLKRFRKNIVCKHKCKYAIEIISCWILYSKICFSVFILSYYRLPSSHQMLFILILIHSFIYLYTFSWKEMFGRNRVKWNTKKRT